MEDSRIDQPRSLSPETATSVAKTLAPEEICVGDYVAVLYEIHETPSFWWCSDATMSSRDELVRLVYTPRKSGEPLEVRAVCLPFVVARRCTGKAMSLDVRKTRLARLTPDYAAVWKAECKPAKKKSK